MPLHRVFIQEVFMYDFCLTCKLLMGVIFCELHVFFLLKSLKGDPEEDICLDLEFHVEV